MYRETLPAGVEALAMGTFQHDTESDCEERLVWVWDLNNERWYSTAMLKSDLRSDGIARFWRNKEDRYSLGFEVTMWRPFGFLLPGY
jgi:hypothetical protein